MKKILLILLVGLTMISYGQKKEKIKGNREVLIKKFLLPDFEALRVGEKFQIGLKKSTDTTRVIIETDDNLFDVIHFKVDEGILSFYTTQEIVKKKRLKITVYIPDHFHSIELIEKGKVYNEEDLSLEELSIKAFDRGKSDLILDIKKKLAINAGNKSHLKMDVTAPVAEIYMDEYAQTDLKASFSQLSLSLNGHSAFNIQGKAKDAEIRPNDKAQYKGENFIIENVSLITKDKTKTHINAGKKLDLIARGEADVYIYNEPEINLKAFKDHAVLYKK